RSIPDHAGTFVAHLRVVQNRADVLAIRFQHRGKLPHRGRFLQASSLFLLHVLENIRSNANNGHARFRPACTKANLPVPNCRRYRKTARRTVLVFQAAGTSLRAALTRISQMTRSPRGDYEVFVAEKSPLRRLRGFAERCQEFIRVGRSLPLPFAGVQWASRIET